MSQTNILFLLDQSGSMASIKQQAISGFNNFIMEQREVEGDEARVSLSVFNNSYEALYTYSPIHSVNLLDDNAYRPNGGTALYDSICKIIQENRGNWGKTILCVMTDGEENSSREFSYAQVADLIKDVQENDGWEVVFLGANIRNLHNFTKGLNIAANNSIGYTSSAEGTMEVYANVSNVVRNMRTNGMGVQ